MAVSPSPKERGFTLIEVLIGLVISVAVLGAFFPLASQASRNVVRAEDRMAALMLADAKLIEAADGAPRIIREETGLWPGNLTWLLKVALDEERRTYKLYRYTLIVTRDGRLVTTLQTLRLGKREAIP